MGLSKLAAQCQACPFVDTCDHKRMEALGYLPSPDLAKVDVKIDTAAISEDLLDRISRVSQIPVSILRGDSR